MFGVWLSKFLHQTLATNVSLVKMGYKDDIRCTFCHEEAENFTHLFWFCRKKELFWKHLFASLKDRYCLSDDYSLNNLVVLGLKVPITPKYFFRLNNSLHLFETHCAFLLFFNPYLDFLQDVKVTKSDHHLFHD